MSDLSAYLRGDASDEEIDRLRAEIQADPSKVDELFAEAELERDLVLAFRAPRRRRAWPFALAAAAALLLILFIPWSSRDLPRLDGGGRVGGRFQASTAATLRYDDGTRLDLAAGTVLDAIDGKRLDLARGVLTADVVKQASPMVVRTSRGEATVLGTRFTLTATPDATRLEVSEGRVRLTRKEDAASVDVAAGHVAVLAEGAPLTALARGWTSIPGSLMSRVAPPGTSSVAPVVGAWSGAAFDAKRSRLLVWGGGYSDYHGNELYAFDIPALSWSRLTDPTPDPRLGQDANDDGTPNGRATYNGLAWNARADRFFACGGVPAGGVGAALSPWIFDVDARRWTRLSPSGPKPAAGAGGACAYDPADGRIWWADSSGIYSLDGERWTRHSEEPVYYMTGAIDPRRRLWILVGQGRALAVDLRTGRPAARATTGGDALLARSNPGFDYDSKRDRFVAWADDPVWTLDPETNVWSAADLPGAPAPTPNGIFGRWRYVPSLDAFVRVSAADQPVRLYRP